ncbi:hypothetical protein E4U44_008634 [Claviceps purpurea]|nr:hypothetical protein E4U44_008634 [Claviceps purpurea]
MATGWLQYGVTGLLSHLEAPLFAQPMDIQGAVELWRRLLRHHEEFYAAQAQAPFGTVIAYVLAQCNVNGGDQPLVRPLYWEYPALTEAFENPTEYYFTPYFGLHLVVAPIVEPHSARTNLARAD